MVFRDFWWIRFVFVLRQHVARHCRFGSVTASSPCGISWQGEPERSFKMRREQLSGSWVATFQQKEQMRHHPKHPVLSDNKIFQNWHSSSDFPLSWRKPAHGPYQEPVLWVAFGLCPVPGPFSLTMSQLWNSASQNNSNHTAPRGQSSRLTSTPKAH